MDLIFFAHLALRTLEVPALIVVFAVLWLMIIGGSFGSFLNVVVYRVPQGLSLIYPSSHCPRCGTPILTRDNVPMLGWLLLRGRCRACRMPISPRYPLVELTTALAFTTLAFFEPICDGWNLPIPQGPADSDYPLWGILALHFALVCTLLGAALITWDREAVPTRYWFVPLVAGFAAAAVWPMLRPVGMPQLAGLGRGGLGPAEGLVGAVIGGLCGVAAWPASSDGVRARSGHVAGVAASACLGIYLGWQAAAVIGLAAMLVWSLWQLLRDVVGFRFNLPWLMIVTGVTFAWLIFWRYLVYRLPLVGVDAPWYLPVVSIAATFILGVAGRTLADAVARRRVHNPVETEPPL